MFALIAVLLFGLDYEAGIIVGAGLALSIYGHRAKDPERDGSDQSGFRALLARNSPVSGSGLRTRWLVSLFLLRSFGINVAEKLAAAAAPMPPQNGQDSFVDRLRLSSFRPSLPQRVFLDKRQYSSLSSPSKLDVLLRRSAQVRWLPRKPAPIGVGATQTGLTMAPLLGACLNGAPNLRFSVPGTGDKARRRVDSAAHRPVYVSQQDVVPPDLEHSPSAVAKRSDRGALRAS